MPGVVFEFLNHQKEIPLNLFKKFYLILNLVMISTTENYYVFLWYNKYYVFKQLMRNTKQNVEFRGRNIIVTLKFPASREAFIGTERSHLGLDLPWRTVEAAGLVHHFTWMKVVL